MNCLLFIASSLCLITLLFVSSQKIKMKLIKYYTLIQSLTAFLTVLLMAKLWFSPFKLELDERSWLNDIKRYTYNSQSKLDNYKGVYQQQQNQLLFQTTPNIILSSSASLPITPDNDLNYVSNNNNINMKRYNYVDLVDKLQYALGCCGILSPDDWRQENQLLGLLAPSCCLQPTHLEISIPLHSGDNTILLGNNSTTIITGSAAESVLSTTTSQRQFMRNSISISYCKIELSNTIGCQNLLSNRQIQFTFNLRMSLLFLLSILIILIMAALNFYAPSNLSNSTRSNQSSPQRTIFSSSNHRATFLEAQPGQQFYLTNCTSPNSSLSPTSNCSSSNVFQGQAASANLSAPKALPFQQADASNHVERQHNQQLYRHNEQRNDLPFSNHIDHSNPTEQQQAVIGQDTINCCSANLNCDTVLTIS